MFALSTLRNSFYIVLLFAITCYADNAPFEKCTERTASAIDVKVDVSDCGSTTRCNLLRGSSSNFSLYFTPSEDTEAELERVIVAKFPPAVNKKMSVEVPYGAALDIANSTKILETLSPLSKNIKQNVPLIHTNLFPVMKGAPAAMLTVRYVIREKVQDVPRNKKNWKLHPGKVLVCVEIPVQLV